MGRSPVGALAAGGRVAKRGSVALCTLGLGLLNPPSLNGRQMSTGYILEGLRQVCATLLGVRHVPECLCGGLDYLGRYNRCSPFSPSPSISHSRDIANFLFAPAAHEFGGGKIAVSSGRQ